MVYFAFVELELDSILAFVLTLNRGHHDLIPEPHFS